MKSSYTTLILILFAVSSLFAQEDANEFEKEIVAFEKQDAKNGYQKDFILFTGSSSIRLWKTMEQDMEGLDILNRGFGGAKLSDLNLFWERIIGEHDPALVVLYCGENDINDGVSVEETFSRFKEFQKKYKKSSKKIPLIYLAMKPSPSRWSKWENFQATDQKIEKLVNKKKNQTYIDLSSTMLTDKGKPKPEIFISDSLHMNELGYQGWTEKLRPLIESTLENE